MGNEKVDKKFIELLSKVPNVAIQGYNKDRIVIYWNKASELIYGYSEGEALGQKLEDLIIPDFMRDDVIHHVENWYKNGVEIPAGELPLQNKNGSTVYVYSSHVMLGEETDNPEMFCIDVDLSKNKEQERLLQLSNIVVESSPVVLFRWKAEAGWPVEYVSGNVTLFGYSANDLLSGKVPYANIIHPDDLQRVGEEVQNYSESGLDFFSQEYRIIAPDGKIFDIDDRTLIERDKNGKITHYQGTILDITERKLNEMKLTEQKQEFESIFNYAKDGIAIVNLDGGFLKANQAFLDITGYDTKEILMKNCTELTTDQYKEINKKALKDTIEKGSVENIEKSCIKKDNSSIDVTMSMSLLPDKKSILLMIHDTTVLKLMQEQAKLASLGEMIGNIAHQWRQPLSLITSSISALRFQSDLDEKITKDDIVKYSDIINNQASYLSNTIDNFRDFIKSDLSYHNLNLNESLDNAIKLVEASLKENFITLDVELEQEMVVYGNSNELAQAFINILNNAKDILKEKVENEKDRVIFIKTNKLDANKIQVSIVDSGGGIDKSIKDKIFEPYFTTKHSYVGTGLGLAMAYKIIVERHNGIIKVRNMKFEYNGQKYKGACFTITLDGI